MKIRDVLFNWKSAVLFGACLGIAGTGIWSKPPEIKMEMPVIRLESMQSIELMATGYAIGHPYNTITKSGVPPVNLGFMRIDGVNIFTIAVDPKVIEPDILVFIKGIGLAMTTDTGPAISGLEVDLCFKNTAQAEKFGRRKVQVYLLGTCASDENILEGKF